MNINSRLNKFHKPLGNYKHPGVCRYQSKLGKHHYQGGTVNDSMDRIDCIKTWQESEGDRFVKGPHSVEAIRR